MTTRKNEITVVELIQMVTDDHDKLVAMQGIIESLLSTVKNLAEIVDNSLQLSKPNCQPAPSTLETTNTKKRRVMFRRGIIVKFSSMQRSKAFNTLLQLKGFLTGTFVKNGTTAFTIHCDTPLEQIRKLYEILRKYVRKYKPELGGIDFIKRFDLEGHPYIYPEEEEQ